MSKVRGQYVNELVFKSDLAVPAPRILHRRTSFPDVMFRIVAEHRIAEIPVAEAAAYV